MRKEWEIYWQRLWKETKFSFLSTVAISLVFFAAYFPVTPKGQQHINLFISFSFGFSIFICIGLLFATFYALVTHLQIKRAGEVQLFKGINLVIGLIGMGFGSLVGTAIKMKTLGGTMTFGTIWFSILFGIFITLMFHYYYSYKKSQQENLALNLKNMESELHVLKNQMQPHFLFNSLNSLLYLFESKSDLAPEMTLLLSDLYREILASSKKIVVNLEEELSIVDKYLRLEKLRFGNRLDYKIILPDTTQDIFIPPLILQTLVENAIKHGISSLAEGGQVQVQVSQAQPGYNVKVSNSGDLKGGSEEGGTGLANSISRLDLLYGDSHKFSMEVVEQSVNVNFWISGERIVKV